MSKTHLLKKKRKKRNMTKALLDILSALIHVGCSKFNFCTADIQQQCCKWKLSRRYLDEGKCTDLVGQLYLNSD